MPKQKPENKLTEKEQWERFKKAAKEAEVELTEADQAFRGLAHESRKSR